MREKEKEMKKRFIAALLLVVMCMGAFSACSLTGKLEKDVQVDPRNKRRAFRSLHGKRVQ